MATEYAALTLQARAEARDLVSQNPISRETPIGDIDGVNVIYYLQNKNIVSGTVGAVNYGPFVTLSTSKRATTGYVLDALNGILTLTVPVPTPLLPPWFVDYFFQWFTDTDYQTWIDQATQELAQTAGLFVGPVAGGGDLTPALIQYVIERFWTARASLYANKYATTAAGASEQIQTVTANFLSLAKAARVKAAAMRVAAYVDPGQKLAPASGTITHNIGRYTPRR